MVQALITVNGVPGTDDDLPINTSVTLSNQGNGGEVTYLWSIVNQPVGASDLLSATNVLSPTFTPTKEGSYLIRLVVNQGMASETYYQAVCGVRYLKSFLRAPAAGESDESSLAAGWSTTVNATFKRFDDSLKYTDIAAVADSGVAIGDVVYVSGDSVIKAGLPGEETLALVSLASLAGATLASSVGVVLEAADGGAVAAGTVVRVRTSGLTTVTGIFAAGSSVYLTNAGGYSNTGSTVQLGVSLSTSGGSSLLYFAPRIAPAGQALLWAWNGSDLTQFSSTPAPDFNGGVTNPELVLLADSNAPTGSVLSMEADDATAGCIWWIDGDYDLASVKRIECVLSFPAPGPAAASSERIQMGFVFAGDDTGTVCAIADLISVEDDGAGLTLFSSILNQFESAGPTNVLLVQDPIFGGYLFNMTLTLDMNRNNATAYGAPGIPRGTALMETTAWAIPPGAAQRPVNGALAFPAFGFFPPGAVWATSKCSKIGLSLSGNWTVLSGAQAISVLSLKFFG